MCSEWVSSSCSTSDTHRVTLATHPVISHKWGKDGILITTNGTYSWSFVTQICRNGFNHVNYHNSNFLHVFPTNINIQIHHQCYLRTIIILSLPVIIFQIFIIHEWITLAQETILLTCRLTTHTLFFLCLILW
jgi:hypothetical protein